MSPDRDRPERQGTEQSGDTRETGTGGSGVGGTGGSSGEIGAAGSPRRSPGGDVPLGQVGTPPGTIATGDTSSKLPPGGEDPLASAESHDSFWRDSFASRDYTDERLGYDHYRDAYRFGWKSRSRGPRGGSFEDVEDRLRDAWSRDGRGLDWDEARPAVRDAWMRAGSDRDDTELSDPENPLA